MPEWLALWDLGDPGWGDPWFPHSAVLLRSHNGMAMWCLCFFVLSVLFMPYQHQRWYNAITSHPTIIIVGTHQMITKNVQCPISGLAWGSKKIQKVVASTLSAETTSLASALDQLAWLRLFWSWIHNPKTQWKQPEKALTNLVPAVSVPTFNETNDVAITDCKSLYDLITRTAPPSCSEFRVQLVARAIKDALRNQRTLGTFRSPTCRLPY